MIPLRLLMSYTFIPFAISIFWILIISHAHHLPLNLPWLIQERTSNLSADQLLMSVWPEPTNYTLGWDTIFLSANVTVSLNGSQSAILQRAMTRYKKLFFARGCSPSQNESASSLGSIQIQIATGDEAIHVEQMDESYTLDIPRIGNSNSAIIKAQSPIGALRGLETLSQLIVPLEEIPPFVLNRGCPTGLVSRFVIRNVPISIRDTPSYRHRGISLDTSRHFIPKDIILTLLDGMSASKMNVFHWHIIDSQSFPVKSEKLPLLWQKGAYSQYQVYSKSDVQQIVSFASDRGIRVIPEFDMPGHAYSWGPGSGLVLCANAKPWETYCAEPPCGQLDISKNETYTMIQTFLNEMASWFPDPIVHLGSDEVNVPCYTDSPSIQSYFKEQNSNMTKLLQVFQDRVQNIVRQNKKRPMFWEDVVLDWPTLVPNDTIMQSWKGPESRLELLRRGYQVVVSDANAWYLDCGHGNFVTGNKSWCDPYKTWANMYAYDPRAEIPKELANGILGGEVALWTEMVNENGVIQAVFPRAAGMGGSLWNARRDRNWNLMAPAMDKFSQLLIARGIKGGVIWPEWCSKDNCYI